MTLNNVYESRGNEYYTPAEGNEYVILEFTVENGGEEEVSVKYTEEVMFGESAVFAVTREEE